VKTAHMEELIADFGARARAPEPGGVASSGGERRRLEIAARPRDAAEAALARRSRSRRSTRSRSPTSRRPCADCATRESGSCSRDHNVRETLSTTDRAYIILDGQILVSGSPAEVIADPTARRVSGGEVHDVRQSEDDFDASMEILDVFTCHWSLVTCHLSLTGVERDSSRAPRHSRK